MRLLFSYAFRPLFLLMTIYAVFVVPYWIAAWLGYLPMPTLLGTPSWWHAHEMIYGFAGAAVGGFALTAVATWTRRPPVAGPPLVMLSGLWLAARLLFASPFSGLREAAMAADLGYGVLLFVLMSREVIGAQSTRNYKVLVILAVLPLANAWFFLGISRNGAWIATSLMAAVWLLILLINVIAGRIIPAFTRNWLKMRAAPEMANRAPKLPPSFDRLDLLTTCLMIAFAALHLADFPSSIGLAALGLLTSGLLALRLLRWRGLETTKEPLVWVLHLAFAWLPIGFLLMGLAQADLAPRSAGIHALTSGAITTMIVAVAGRAALGHTNRPLRSHPALTTAYLAITISAVCRVLAAFGPGARMLLAIAAAAWCLGFFAFAWRYVPILTQPKLKTAGSLPLA
ncbi:MAG: hypothetical protein AMJ62_11705 [Myxococcales bacterium SG8_38]|nr:MAG: hypothetical protein AMJ62_11705 [Myxococcales bacterium SG8_38]